MSHNDPTPNLDGDDPEPDSSAPLHLRVAWRDRDLARRKAHHAKIREERRNAYRATATGPGITLLDNTGPTPSPSPPPPAPAANEHGTNPDSQPTTPTAPALLPDDTPLTAEDYRRAIARIVRTPGVRAADALKALELDAKLTARMGSVIDDSRERATMPEPGSPEWSGNLQLIMQAQQSQIARAVREARERRGDIATPPTE